MRITFDSAKQASNQTKHGYDFADLDMAFFDRSTLVPARDDRLMAIGRFGDTIITVIFRPLGSEAVSIISMRDASLKERSLL
jgi:uncharacterized DUF497 family protein